MDVLRTEHLNYIYGHGTPFEIAAIQDVNVAVRDNELVGIIGHTGSGKSTLIQHFNGLLKPESGTVYLDGKDIWAEPKKIRDVRFRVGLCFQYPEYQLFEETVYKDIAFGPKNMGLDPEEIDRRVRDAARSIGLDSTLLEKSPFDISGGEKRRAAIAGVIAMEPRILILDEPTAGLDPRGRDRVLGQIKEYQRERKTTVILVSHSMEDIARMSDRVLVMNQSKVAMFDTVDEVYSRSDELLDMGLNVPQVTRIFMGLRAKGYEVGRNVYTVEQGRREILRLTGREGAPDA